MEKQAGHREHLLPPLHPPPHRHRLDHRDRRPRDGSGIPLRTESGRLCALDLLHVGGDHPPPGPHPQDLLRPLVQHARPGRRLLHLHHLLRGSRPDRGCHRVLCSVHRATRRPHHQDCQDLLREAKPGDRCQATHLPKQEKVEKPKSEIEIDHLFQRYQQDGFDLDLTYVTNRVIATSFPSTGIWSLYRFVDTYDDNLKGCKMKEKAFSSLLIGPVLWLSRFFVLKALFPPQEPN